MCANPTTQLNPVELQRYTVIMTTHCATATDAQNKITRDSTAMHIMKEPNSIT